MLTQAGVALAETVSAADLKCGCLFPSISRLREVTIHVATRVARAAINEHVAPPITGDIEEAVRAAVWDPEYLTYHPL